MSGEYDWNNALKVLTGSLKDQFKTLVEGAAEDVGAEGMAREVAAFIVEGIRSGDKAMLEEAKANVPWLLQNHQLKLKQATNATISKVIGVASDLAFGLLGKLI